MTITIDAELEAALMASAQRQGIPADVLVLKALRALFLVPAEPRDEWERLLRQAATDCGVSLPHEALSSEGLYE